MEGMTKEQGAMDQMCVGVQWVLNVRHVLHTAINE
jgi:hypothetical protein